MFKSLPGLLLLHILLLQQDAFSQEVTEEPGLLSGKSFKSPNYQLDLDILSY